MPAKLMESVRHLHGQLTRWDQNQALRFALAGLQGLQDGQSKRGGFPRARLRLADHVVAVQYQRNNSGLDWGRLGIAELSYCLHQLWVQAQAYKISCHRSSYERFDESTASHSPCGLWPCCLSTADSSRK